MADYDRIRVMWPDHLGLPRGKYLPAHLAYRGTNHCASTFALGYDRSLIPAPGTYLLEGLKDVHSSFSPGSVRPSWEDDRTGVAVGHLNLDAKPYSVSARGALERAIADWEALGYQPKVGLELEGYVLEPDGDGGWRRWSTPRSFVYATGRLADPTGLIDDIMVASESSGFAIESINAEFDESQFEMTLVYDDALKAADDAFLFRVMAREMALERGLDLTFLGRPFPEVSGSGLHVNFSLVDDSGANILVDDDAADGLSVVAKQSLAGLCEHHQAMTPLLAPTINAYRRLVPGELTGYWANWGYEHRCAANRVPDDRGQSTRIESRLGDGSANIHLAVAAVLQAARLGVANEMDCPDPLTTDGFEEVNTDVCSASDLSTALDHLEANTALSTAVGSDLVDNFVANKRAEWDRYIEATGGPGDDAKSLEWELNQYLMYH